MALEMRWVGPEELNRVALTRLRCYAPGINDLERFQERTRTDPRQKPGDFLLAERDGQAVGTATSLSLTTWVRGVPLPCQGVAWVGALRTERRKSRGGDSPGVATAVMIETLRRARERGEVLSALMPFRASFYEHFGYGVVERQTTWTVPISILPAGSCEGVRFFQSGDEAELNRARQRIVQQGQCDVERTPEMWGHLIEQSKDGFFVVDQPEPGGPITGWVVIRHRHEQGKDYVHVGDLQYESVAALKRLLHFFSSLKDQYFAAVMTLPADLPLNWLLRESQVPHRPVNHPVAELRPFTRMQVRILDHQRFVESIHWPIRGRGKATVAVHEAEGHTSKFSIDLSEGRAKVTTGGAAADVEMSDRVWAAVACGDLPASRAAGIGLISSCDPQALALLDLLSAGPAPFSWEYF